MTDFAHTLEAELRAKRLLDLGVDWADEMVFPAYDGLSIRNVPHSVATLLGVEQPDPVPLDARVWGDDPPQTANRVIQYLMDGMGYLLLCEMIDDDPELRQIIMDLTDGRGPAPLTSVTPSTTAVALPSLWTGHSPGGTGMLGTRMFLREFSTMADMLSYRPALGDLPENTLNDWGIKAADFVPVTSLGERLHAAGVSGHIIMIQRYIGSGLSRILHRGLRHFHPYVEDFELWEQTETVLKMTAGQRAYVAIYRDAVDMLSHVYGATHDEVFAEIKREFRQLRDILSQPAVQDGQTVFTLVADHGHADATQLLNLAQDPGARPIYDALRCGTGSDMRLPYLYLRDGSKGDVIAAVESVYGDRIVALDSAAALEAGLFGPPPYHRETIRRIGDVVLVPRRDWVIQDPSLRDPKFISFHAGLLDREMLVPFVWKWV